MQNKVTPKKYLGQHFLKDQNLAKNIVDALQHESNSVIEIGPGTGVLTQFLVKKPIDFIACEIDKESIVYLKNIYKDLTLVETDFLKQDLSKLPFKNPYQKLSIIGNFPYHISSQIVVKVFENHEIVEEMVGMFQKEVCDRLAAKPGNKTYGILSVYMQSLYDIEYLYTVSPEVFNPPPKVMSAVIRFKRNPEKQLNVDVKLFVSIIRATFNNRRKMIRNTIKSFIPGHLSDKVETLNIPFLEKRPEQLSYQDFILLTEKLASLK